MSRRLKVASAERDYKRAKKNKVPSEEMNLSQGTEDICTLRDVTFLAPKGVFDVTISPNYVALTSPQAAVDEKRMCSEDIGQIVITKSDKHHYVMVPLKRILKDGRTKVHMLLGQFIKTKKTTKTVNNMSKTLMKQIYPTLARYVRDRQAFEIFAYMMDAISENVEMCAGANSDFHRSMRSGLVFMLGEVYIRPLGTTPRPYSVANKMTGADRGYAFPRNDKIMFVVAGKAAVLINFKYVFNTVSEHTSHKFGFLMSNGDIVVFDLSRATQYDYGIFLEFMSSKIRGHTVVDSIDEIKFDPSLPEGATVLRLREEPASTSTPISAPPGLEPPGLGQPTLAIDQSAIESLDLSAADSVIDAMVNSIAAADADKTVDSVESNQIVEQSVSDDSDVESTVETVGETAADDSSTAVDATAEDSSTAADTTTEDSSTAVDATAEDSSTAADTTTEDSLTAVDATGEDSSTAADTTTEDSLTAVDATGEDSSTVEDTTAEDPSTAEDTTADEEQDATSDDGEETDFNITKLTDEEEDAPFEDMLNKTVNLPVEFHLEIFGHDGEKLRELMDECEIAHVHVGYDGAPQQVRVFGEDRELVKHFVKELRNLVNQYHKAAQLAAIVKEQAAAATVAKKTARKGARPPPLTTEYMTVPAKYHRRIIGVRGDVDPLRIVYQKKYNVNVTGPISNAGMPEDQLALVGLVADIVKAKEDIGELVSKYDSLKQKCYEMDMRVMGDVLGKTPATVVKNEARWHVECLDFEWAGIK